jgi:hypothetical protein
LLSYKPLVCVTGLVRRGAPTDRRRTPLLIVLATAAAAAAGAFFFPLSCPLAERLGIVACCGCGAVTLASGFLLAHFARW